MKIQNQDRMKSETIVIKVQGGRHPTGVMYLNHKQRFTPKSVLVLTAAPPHSPRCRPALPLR